VHKRLLQYERASSVLYARADLYTNAVCFCTHATPDGVQDQSKALGKGHHGGVHRRRLTACAC
jgi:hypothetical protein